MSVARKDAKRPKTRDRRQKTFTRMLDDERMKQGKAVAVAVWRG